MSNEKTKRKGLMWGCIGCLSVVLAVVLVVGIVLGGMLLRDRDVTGLFAQSDTVIPQTDGVQQQNSLLQITEFPELYVTDEATAAQALLAMQSDIGFAEMEEFGKPVRSDAPHYTYYRFPQMLDGLEVSGRAVILCVGQNGAVRGVSGNYASLGGVDTEGRIDAQGAEKALRKHYGKDAFVHVEERCILLQGEEPVCAWRALVFARGEAKQCWVDVQKGKVVSETLLTSSFDVLGNGRDEDGTPRVFTTDQGADGSFIMKDTARNIRLYDAQGGRVAMSIPDGNIGLTTPEGEDYYTFIVENGEIVSDEIEEDGAACYVMPMMINDDEGVAYLYETSDGSYTLRDEQDRVITQEPILTFVPHEQSVGSDYARLLADEDNVWHDYTAVSAKYAIEQAHDVYADILGRNGYDGKGGALHLTIRDLNGEGSHGCNHSLDFMGQHLAIIQLENGVPIELNVLAHEYTHAVLGTLKGTADDTREAGTIEEALCDFFGELAEDYEGDHVLNNSNDWVNSDRNLMTPAQSSSPMPRQYKAENWYTDEEADQKDEAGVQMHHNSTVLSHALYRMSMGIGQDEYIEPVGNEKMAHFVYDVMQNLTAMDGFHQVADLMRSTAHRMCVDGVITEKQARCVYIALENALLYPTFTVAPDAELVFHDLMDEQMQEYDLYISKANFDVRPMSFTDGGDDIKVRDGVCRLDLEAGESYRVIVKDKEDPSMCYTAQLKIKEGAASELVVKTDVFPQYEVINNGGHYVACGPHVYYWKYNQSSFAQTGLLGYFGQNQSAVNQLVRRDASGEEVVLLEDAGYGELFIAKRRIYYQTGEGLKSCGLDGADVRSHAGEFTILAVEPETDTLIYRDQRQREATAENQIYVEDADGNRITLTRDNFDHDGAQPELLAVGGGQIYYLRNHDNRDGKHSLIVLGADMAGQTRHVGSITYERDDYDGVDVYAQLVEDTLYVSYALVQGTGLFYNNGGVAAMNTAREEATEYIIEQNTADALCFAATHVSVDPDTGARTLHFSSEFGSGARYDWLEDNVRAMDLQSGQTTGSDLPLVRAGDYAVTDGDIVTVSGTDASATMIASARALDAMGYAEFVGASDAKGGYELSLVDVMGEYAFIEIIETKRDSSIDLGWRYGYQRVRTTVYVTRIGTDEMQVLYEY